MNGRFVSGATASAAAIAIFISGFIGEASATDDVLAGTACSSDNFVEGDPGACLFGVSSTVTNGATLRLNSAVAGDAARRDAEADEQLSLRSSPTGIAAGEQLAGFGVWSNYSHSNFKGDLVFANARLGYDGKSNSIYFGVDRLLGGRYLLGLAAGYEDTSTTTAFNGGGADTDGLVFAPYAAWLINDVFSLDATAGYGRLDTAQNRISTVDGSRVTSSYGSRRLFIASNLNATVIRGNVVFGGQIGVLHTKEKQDAFNETGNAASSGRLWKVRQRDIKLTQFVASIDAGLSLDNGFEPYARLAWRNDLSRDNGVSAGGLMAMFTQLQDDDDDEWEVGGGVRYFGDGISGGLELFTTRGREAFKNWSVLANVRFDL